MKKFTILSMLILFSFNIVYSVDFSYGFKAGWNYSFVNGNGFDSKYPSYGYLAGIFQNLKFNRLYSVQSGIFFSKKGGTTGESLNTESVNIDYGLSYMDLPFFLSFQPLAEKNWSLKANLGGYISYLIHEDFQIQNDQGVNEVDIDIENYDYGILIGLGSIFFQQYSLDIQYQKGLNDIFVKYQNFQDKDYEMYNNTLSIVVGFYIL